MPDKLQVAEKLQNEDLKTAIKENRATEWISANYSKLCEMDKMLLQLILTSEEQYALQDATSNPEGDPSKSLYLRDSQNIVKYFLGNLDRLSSRDDYEETLVYVWVKGEYGQFTPEDWADAFARADSQKLLMAGSKLPKKVQRKDGKITVYQGGNMGGDCRYNSWTTDKNVAIKFAWMKWRQFDEHGSFIGFLIYSNPTVYKATICVDDILFYTNMRKEHEIVVKTDKIPTDIQAILTWDRKTDKCPRV